VTDPKLAAEEAARKIILSLVVAGRIDPEGAKAMTQTISGHVLSAITRCTLAPSEGLGR